MGSRNVIADTVQRIECNEGSCLQASSLVQLGLGHFECVCVCACSGNSHVVRTFMLLQKHIKGSRRSYVDMC